MVGRAAPKVTRSTPANHTTPRAYDSQGGLRLLEFRVCSLYMYSIGRYTVKEETPYTGYTGHLWTDGHPGKKITGAARCCSDQQRAGPVLVPFFGKPIHWGGASLKCRSSTTKIIPETLKYIEMRTLIWMQPPLNVSEVLASCCSRSWAEPPPT